MLVILLNSLKKINAMKSLFVFNMKYEICNIALRGRLTIFTYKLSRIYCIKTRFPLDNTHNILIDIVN